MSIKETYPMVRRENMKLRYLLSIFPLKKKELLRQLGGLFDRNLTIINYHSGGQC